MRMPGFGRTSKHSSAVVPEKTAKGWRIEVLHHGDGWKALVYRTTSPLHEITVPNRPDRRAVIEGAKELVDKLLVL
jgi:hypothetical protein